MNRFFAAFIISLFAVVVSLLPIRAHAEMTDMPVIKLQSLDKVSARTMTFEARVGSTVKFGSLYIKTKACRKAPPIDQPESAAFLQIWEVTPKDNQPHWVFSGWMFASSPALSSMDHPIYDVWVLDCLERKTGEAAPASAVPTQGPAAEAVKMALILPPARPEAAKKEKQAKPANPAASPPATVTPPPVTP
jgi:hypothetical protein